MIYELLVFKNGVFINAQIYDNYNEMLEELSEALVMMKEKKYTFHICESEITKEKYDLMEDEPLSKFI